MYRYGLLFLLVASPAVLGLPQAPSRHYGAPQKHYAPPQVKQPEQLYGAPIKFPEEVSVASE